jgi:glutamyl/glutaminyl-tRNA synthetase
MSPDQIFHKTRIAPTPNGFLHLGNVLSFAITAALARRTKTSILLRIDDLDIHRSKKAYVQDIFDTLHFMEIPWDEGPKDYPEFVSTFSQVHRMEHYQRLLEELTATGNVFACTCSRAEIAKIHPDGTYPGTCRGRIIERGEWPTGPTSNWRLQTNPDSLIDILDVSGTRTQTALPASMTDFIIRKKDGFPAYQLTSVADDIYFGIDLIVRGSDLWPSTVAQQYMSRLLKDDPLHQTTFHHHPLLLEGDHRKLSKSTGATSIQYLRKEGRSREDIYTMIAGMLGHNDQVRNFEELGHRIQSNSFLRT